MCSYYSKADSVLESSFQAMISGMRADQAEILERNRDTFLESMHEHINENKRGNIPTMGIGDVHIGSVTINIFAITSLLISELATAYTGTDLHILLAAAVFICSFLNAFEIDDSVKLNEEGALVYCVLKQLTGDKKSGAVMVPREKLIDQLKEKGLDIDIDKALQLLRDKKLVAFKGNRILVLKVRTVSLA